MDTIFKVILWIAAAIFAYAAVSAVRRTRTWSPIVTIGAYLAFFGGATYGLLLVQSFYTRKLTDITNVPSQNDLLAGGLVILVAVVVLGLDLLGKVDIVGQIRKAASGGDSNSANPGPTPPTTKGEF